MTLIYQPLQKLMGVVVLLVVEEGVASTDSGYHAAMIHDTTSSFG